ncbi:MAG TPA: hypothetical protein DEA90_04005 [Opitutae bacterium]|nr:hypothetical protein [Puniceicoccaceae bacterium]HBR93309.1 hypothetical protein [Opitutae bacterium]|tara:strand:- start:226 stop:708 length:483 start_codon:yes stop_codon:yes gene_type:complete
MRERFWKNLINTKFQAYYYIDLAWLIENGDRMINFIIGFVSSASIAAWALWDNIPWLWASIVVVSQIIIVAKPYLPFIKDVNTYIEYSYDLERLYLEYEGHWHQLEKVDFDGAEEIFKKLRQSELAINEKFKKIQTPDLKILSSAARRKIDKFVEIQFPT